MKGKNTYVQITLTPFQLKKLKLTCARTGLSKSGVIQRLIENYDLKGVKKEELEEERQ